MHAHKLTHANLTTCTYTTTKLQVLLHDSRIRPVTSMPMYLVILKTRVTLEGSISLSCEGLRPEE